MTQQEVSECLYGLKSQIEALETRLNSMELLMKRPNKENYEKLVDVVLEHDKRINSIEKL
tara:strand:+ start:72 stop:251 length:180 start_codon:yes stop_codon:yes gene_type:complete